MGCMSCEVEKASEWDRAGDGDGMGLRSEMKEIEH
jgi:hypothetical protein